MDPESFQVCLNFQWATKTFDGLIFQDNFLDVTLCQEAIKKKMGKSTSSPDVQQCQPTTAQTPTRLTVGVGHLG